MGCFSFICKCCGEPILSDSSNGEPVTLFVLKKGKVLEQMSGEYDSYGRCFKQGNEESYKWDIEWNDVCELMFNGSPKDGMAAIHQRCGTDLIPTTVSEDDPNQGWGRDFELMSGRMVDPKDKCRYEHIVNGYASGSPPSDEEKHFVDMMGKEIAADVDAKILGEVLRKANLMLKEKRNEQK